MVKCSTIYSISEMYFCESEQNNVMYTWMHASGARICSSNFSESKKAVFSILEC